MEIPKERKRLLMIWWRLVGPRISRYLGTVSIRSGRGIDPCHLYLAAFRVS